MIFQKILCPIDFSTGSQSAMRTAVRIANNSDAELVLVHAWYLPPVGAEGYVYSQGVSDEIMEDARRGLESALRDAAALGAKRASTRLVTGGPPWSAIIGVLADDPAFDLVVAGTHGRTGLSRVLLGSVAETIVRRAPCSVLVVHPTYEPKPFTHVLCPVDFSDDAEYAAGVAAHLVEPKGTGLTLLHVVETPMAHFGDRPITDVVRDLDERSKQLLDVLAVRLRAEVSVPVTPRTREGRFPGARILETLEEDPSVDLVVMSSRGRTKIRRALLGSVAEKIVRHAACPVLVARRRTPGRTSPGEAS